MILGKGMADMIATLVRNVTGMGPDEIKKRIEETGTLVKNTLGHFDGRLAAIEARQAETNRILGDLQHGEETTRRAGYGAATGSLIPCPDFAGPENDGRGDAWRNAGAGTAGPAGNPSGGALDGGDNGTPARRVIQ